MSNQAQGGVAEKKGLPTLAWIGIGCGAIVVIVAIVLVVAGLLVAKKAKEFAGDFEGNPALTVARMIVKANPELEEVSTDEDAGTITIRNTKTGEEITVNFEDVENGNISFSSGDKKVTVSTGDEGGRVEVSGEQGETTWSSGGEAKGARPDWAPVYPGTTPAGEHTMSSGEGFGGGFELSTGDSLDAVVEFYKQRLEASGFEVGVNTFSGGGERVAMISGSDEANERTVIVNVRTDDGETAVAISYSQGL